MLKTIKIIDLFTVWALICLRWWCADQKSEKKTIVTIKKTPKTLNCYPRSQNNFGGLSNIYLQIKKIFWLWKRQYWGSQVFLKQDCWVFQNGQKNLKKLTCTILNKIVRPQIGLFGAEIFFFLLLLYITLSPPKKKLLQKANMGSQDFFDRYYVFFLEKLPQVPH